MPSVTYMNQSAPFWDFVASLEQQGQSHPFFSQNQNDNNERGEEGNPFGPWGWPGWGWGQQRAFPHRGPPPPPGPPPHHEQSGEDLDTKKEGEKEKEKEEDAVNEKDNGEGPSGSGSGSDAEGHPCGRHGRHGGCGGRRGRHGFGGPHGHGHHGPGGFGPRHGPPHHGPHHGPHGRGRGRWGGPWGGRGGPFGGAFNPMDFVSSLFDPVNATADAEKSSEQDFTPEADIFDTSSSYVVHISLPGAKKEDVGVNWDAEKSELSIAGVIYRPGDEEFLKTLAMDERKVGPFERKIRLGTRVNPASIDAEGISAKLEDGVLRVDVPKLEGEFVEVRKVDIE